MNIQLIFNKLPNLKYNKLISALSVKCYWKCVDKGVHLTHWCREKLTAIFMMTSSNGNIFRVTGPLYGEFTGPRWIPLTKASDAGLDVFFDLCPNKRLSKQL